MEFLSTSNEYIGLLLSTEETAKICIEHISDEFTGFGVILYQLPILFGSRETITELLDKSLEFQTFPFELIEIDKYYPFRIMEMLKTNGNISSLDEWLSLYDYVDLDQLQKDILSENKDLQGIIQDDGIYLDKFPCLQISESLKLYYFWKTNRTYPGVLKYPGIIPYQSRQIQIPIQSEKSPHPWSGSSINLTFG